MPFCRRSVLLLAFLASSSKAFVPQARKGVFVLAARYAYPNNLVANVTVGTPPKRMPVDFNIMTVKSGFVDYSRLHFGKYDYRDSSTFNFLEKKFDAVFGYGQWGSDFVRLGKTFPVTKLRFGLITNRTYTTPDFFVTQIIGLGPLSRQHSPDSMLTTLSRRPRQKIFSIWVEPKSLNGTRPAKEASITFSDIDHHCYLYEAFYTKHVPAKYDGADTWGFRLDTIYINHKHYFAMIDVYETAAAATHPYYVVGPEDALDQIAQQLGAHKDGLFYFVECNRRATLPDISFNIGTSDIWIGPEDYVLVSRYPCTCTKTNYYMFLSDYSKDRWCAASSTCVSVLSGCMDDQRIRIPYNCPAAALPPNFSYNDGFVRKQIMPLLCAANEMNRDEVQRSLVSKFVHVQRLNLYDVPCDTHNNVICHAYSALLPGERAKVFVFRGARDPRMFLQEASNIFTHKQLVPLEVTEGYVYDSYLDIFRRIWSTGMQREAELLAADYKNYETWVVGYSLGGALASIASVFIYKENLASRALLKQVTLGQPRTGDLDFARVHDLFVPNSFRIIHRFDPVPLTPVRDAFQPANAQPFHHRYEVWYPNRMNTNAVHVVAKSAEDPMGRAAKLESEADDHLKYFDVDVSTCTAHDV